MKIEAMDRREFLVTEQEAEKFSVGDNKIYKINGHDYYICLKYKFCLDLYAIRFISCNSFEVEVEEIGDECENNG